MFSADFGRFRRILASSGAFWRILVHSGAFLRLVMFLLYFGLPFTEDHNFLNAFLQARAVENEKRRQDDLRAGKSDQQPSGPAKENRYTDGIPIDERQNDNKTFK